MVLTAILIVWEAAVVAWKIPLYVLPSPSSVLSSFAHDFGTLRNHAYITVLEALAGMGIALALSLALGVLLDAFPSVKSAVYPILVVTQTVPMIVLAPIFIIYLGFGVAPKILTVVLMCFFPIVVSFADSMQHMNPQFVHLARSFGANKAQVYTLIKIPAALPNLFSGLKVAATYSISGAVVGEWISSQRGLGYYLLKVKNGYMLNKVFACVLMIILLSLAMNGLVALFRHLLTPSKQKKIYRSEC